MYGQEDASSTLLALSFIALYKLDVVFLVFIEFAGGNLVAIAVIPLERVEIIAQAGILEFAVVTGIDGIAQYAQLAAV